VRLRAGLDWEKLYRKEIEAPLRPFATGARVREGTRGEAQTSIVTQELSLLDSSFAEFASSEEQASAAGDKTHCAWSTALCDAAARGDLQGLRELVKNGAPINACDYDKRTAMHLVASEGKLDVLRFLVEEADADLSPIDRWGGTPLDDALLSKHANVVTYLTARGAVRGAAHHSGDRDTRQVSLCEAAAAGNIPLLRELFVSGVPIGKGDYDRRTATHVAASEGLLEVVQFLIEEAHCAASPEDRWGGTPLDDAVRSGHASVVAYLSKRGARRGKASLAKADSSKPGSVWEAAVSSDLRKLRALVAEGCDMGAGDFDKRTAMHLAASDGLLEVVQFLAEEAGADLSPKDRWGGTPLDDAIRAHHSHVVSYLRKRGATAGAAPGAHSGGVSASELIDAVQSANVDALRALMARGADVNAANHDRRTALHLAASEGLLNVVRLLVEEASAALSPVDRWGGTPLDDAIRHNEQDVARYLTERGALSARGLVVSRPGADPRGMDVREAASTNNVTAMRVLITQGASVNAPDYDKRTALHVAAAEGNLEVVELLVIEAKAHLNPLDRWGSTPLDEAVRSRSRAVVEFLSLRGAVRMKGARIASGSTGNLTSAPPSPKLVAQADGSVKLRPIVERGDRDGSMKSQGSDEPQGSPRSPHGGRHGADDADCAAVAALPVVQPRADPLECPLSKCRFVDPVVASDGHTYERKHITDWLSAHGTYSPLTHHALDSRHLYPNGTLRALIHILDAEARSRRESHTERFVDAPISAAATQPAGHPDAHHHHHHSGGCAPLSARSDRSHDGDAHPRKEGHPFSWLRGLGKHKSRSDVHKPEGADVATPRGEPH
jgi:ankyrin repeat protein